MAIHVETPPYTTLSTVDPFTTIKIIQKATRAKNERKKMQIPRMSFASMGCTLSSIRKRPGASTIYDHV
tara:strand:+ start:213 stop:419 length:207 start_codon:yes stop_codon:yes gene_type:complete